MQPRERSVATDRKALLVHESPVPTTVGAMIASAAKRIILMDPGTEGSILALSEVYRIDPDMLPPAVQARALFRDSLITDQPAALDVGTLRDAGFELRAAPELPATVLVIDNLVFVVATGTAHPDLQVVHSQSIADVVTAAFEMCWQRTTSSEVPSSAPRPPSERLTDLELSVLRLLADGHKDETAARMLNTSTRTLRRVVANLMDRLGSSTRFQAAVRAQQLGWIK